MKTRDFEVYWHNILVASLVSRPDGTWVYTRDPNAIQIETSTELRSDGLPKYLAALLPESGEREFDDIQAIGDKGARLLSSIALVKKGDPPKMRGDTLHGTLDQWGDQEFFSGTIGGIDRLLDRSDSGYTYSESFLTTFRHELIPKMSGANAKLPMFLDENGVLSPSIGLPFTHIMKVRGLVSTNQLLPVMEQYGMLMLSYAGIKTEKFCHGRDGLFGNFFIAERFDISADPEEFIVAEDMGSIMGVANREKYDPDLIDVCEAMMRVVTNPAESGAALFQQIVASRLLLNNDLHVKNLSIVKRANTARTGFEEVTISPAYDVTVGIGIIHDDYVRKMALRISGKDEYGLDELLMAASAIGIPRKDARQMIQVMSERFLAMAEPLSRCVQASEVGQQFLSNAAAGIKAECEGMLHDLQAKRTRRLTF